MLSIGSCCASLGVVFLFQTRQFSPSNRYAVNQPRGKMASSRVKQPRVKQPRVHKTASSKGIVVKQTPEEKAAVAALSAERLSDAGLSREAYAFKQRVYNLHVARGARSGRTRIYDLPTGQLATIPGTDIKMRSDAAAQLGRLLAAARADLVRDLATTGEDAPTRERRMRARRVRELAINNAYRSASRQFGIWDRNFQKYLEATQEKRRAVAGGEHGEAAAELLRDYIGVRVASPGYSNHQGGIAVDLALRLQPDPEQPGAQTPKELGASMAQVDPWKDSWFWHWLKKRAGEFGFVEYEPEPWHWEYKPQQAAQETTQK